MKKIKKITFVSFLALTGLLTAPAAHAGLYDPPQAGWDLYVSDATKSTIQVYSATGVSQGVFASTANLLSGSSMNFDLSGNLYVTSYASGNIKKYTTSGSGSNFANFANPWLSAFDSAGNLYVDAFGPNIEKFSLAGTDLGSFNSTNVAHTGLAFDSAGNLYYGDNSDFSIHKITPGGSDSVFTSSGVGNPGAMVFDSAGDLFEYNASTNKIEKYTSTGGVLSTTGSVFSSSLLGGAMAFDSVGNLYATNYSGNAIEEFSSAGVDLGVFATLPAGDTTGSIAFGAAPTPEPSTAVALIGGCGLLLGLRRRRATALATRAI